MPKAMLALAVLGGVAIVVSRLLGWVPPDLTAYLAAVDVWRDGLNPYTDRLFDSPRSDGYPFLYPPASLWLFLPLDFMSTTWVAALDGIARLAVAAALVAWIRRRFLAQVEVGWVALAAVMCSPLLVDAITGNLATYMLGAVALVIAMSEREATPTRAALVLAAGVVIAIKPMWAIPAVYAVVCARRAWAFAALAAGGGSVAIASVAQRHLFVSWIQRVEEVSDFYASVDFLKVAPALAPVAALLWLAPAAYLAVKRVPSAWVFGLASVFMWPRLAVYSYLITAPILAFIADRLGWRTAAVLGLPVLGPLPWLLRDPAGGIYERWTLLIWATSLAILVFVLLLRGADESWDGKGADESTQ
jgi:hypothetical protein